VRVILRLLAWLILAYRRWLSGRGPLRSVRCSFAQGESCSAYGLRATAEAATAREAIGRILRRLGRCRDACLLGDGRTLSWARLHDRSIEEIAGEMRRDGEREPAIARMLGTRRAVALWRAEHAAVRALAGTAGVVRPLVCSHPATQARSRRRLAGLVALAATAAFALELHPVLGATALCVAAIAAANAARTWASRGARFALHAALARRWAALRPRPAHLRARAA
jgi:putative component of membrane protein insertase Oxa1/YidC/SpoIIIJ protein YidD